LINCILKNFFQKMADEALRFLRGVPLRDGNMQQAEEEHTEQEQDDDSASSVITRRSCGGCKRLKG
jgi:hypothetical protein